MNSTTGSATIYDMEDARRRKSDMPGAEYRDAGSWLASVREEAGITVAEAAERTHIKERALEAIEALDLANLPARPYAIGFVKTYADFLGLNAQDVLDRFKEDAGYSAPQPVEPEKFEEAEKAAPVERPELSLLAVIGIIAFMLWCAWQVTLPRDVELLGERRAAPDAAPADAPAVAAPVPAAVPEDIVPPQLAERVDPIYPLACIDQARTVETVTLAYTITAAGRVTGERVASSSNACFDQPALLAVRRWRYEPQTVNGAARPAYDQRIDLVFERPL